MLSLSVSRSTQLRLLIPGWLFGQWAGATVPPAGVLAPRSAAGELAQIGLAGEHEGCGQAGCRGCHG